MSKRFPLFAVETMVHADVSGRVEPSKWVGEGYGVALRVGDRFVLGQFAQADTVAGSARVRLNDVTDVAVLRPGESYAFLDLYWGDLAILVLDRSREWRQTRFQPVDAIQQFSDGHRVLSKASPGQADGTVVPGGWDHEHCEICYEKLGPQGQSIGWTSSLDEWLCNACYDEYLVPRSLDFVNVE